MVQFPPSLVMVERLIPVLTSVTFTDVCGTLACEESVTVPSRVPLSAWPKTAVGAPSIKKKNHVHRLCGYVFLFIYILQFLQGVNLCPPVACVDRIYSPRTPIPRRPGAIGAIGAPRGPFLEVVSLDGSGERT